MPPRPMVPPPGVGAGPGGPPMPPPGMPMRKRGGRVAGATKGDGTKPAPTGGSGDGPAFKEGWRAGTQVSHSGNKEGNTKAVGRSKPVTFAKGGGVPSEGGLNLKAGGIQPVTAGPEAKRRLVKFWAGGSVGKKAGGAVGPLYSRNAPMGPEFEGGAGGGEARLEKAKRAKSHYKAA